MKKLLVRVVLLMMVVLSANAGTVAEALSAPDRLPADLERDARSRPDVVLGLLEISPGDRVADIFAGSGYYSEIIGRVVSPGGEVLMYNNQAYIGSVGEALEARFEGRDVPAFMGQIVKAPIE